MVSSVCRGSYPSMIPHASPSRKPHIDPQKDYTVPLQVETSVEYDLPAHIYPPKDSEPILMIHPGYVSAVRARSRAVVTPSPTAMVATSGAARPLAPLQLPQQQQHLVSGSTSVRSSSSRSVTHPRSWCACGNPNCSNTSSVKSVNVQPSANNIVQSVSARSVQSNNSSTVNTTSRSVQNSLKSVQNIQNQNLPASVNIMGISASRNGTVLIQQQQQQQQQPMLWGGGNGGRCVGPCCNPRAGAMAPIQAEFVAPGLPPSLLARTPTRGTAGGSPKLRAARTRRGLSVASSVNLPDYLGNTRVGRATGGGAVHAHPRPRALSTSMGALAATPAPPMAHQQHTGMGASLALTPRSLISVQQQQQQQAVSASTASLLYTVGLSRDSGCSVGAETAGGEWAASERTRGLVDSGFCTPVDLSDDFVADTLSLGASWKEPSTPLPSSMTSSSISTSSNNISISTSSSGGIHHTSSLLPGAAAHSHNHYLPQPLWNLAY